MFTPPMEMMFWKSAARGTCLTALRLCGFVGCPKDSCKEVLRIADYVSPVEGGHGAMRDVVEHILTERGEWEKAIKDSFGFGI